MAAVGGTLPAHVAEPIATDCECLFAYCERDETLQEKPAGMLAIGNHTSSRDAIWKDVHGVLGGNIVFPYTGLLTFILSPKTQVMS